MQIASIRPSMHFFQWKTASEAPKERHSLGRMHANDFKHAISVCGMLPDEISEGVVSGMAC